MEIFMPKHKGYKWIYNSSLNKVLLVKIEELKHYLDNGWILGRKLK